MGTEFALFVAVGFFAQMVDGALGMAFGIIASTCLIASGTPPISASAAVHAAEVVTTGVSGASHILHRNVDWGLLRRLAMPGVIGGTIGAYVYTMLGLIVGGGLAAPLGARLIKVLPIRYALILVGTTVSALTLVNMVVAFA